jgi:hypothetical protein
MIPICESDNRVLCGGGLDLGHQSSLIVQLTVVDYQCGWREMHQQSYAQETELIITFIQVFMRVVGVVDN